MNTIPDQSQAHAFDALIGSWKVTNRRKKGSYFLPDQARGEAVEWEEFTGHDHFETQLDGRAVVEHWAATLPSGEQALGYSVKAFEPTTGQWAIIWIDNRNPLDFRPLWGTFEAGVGVFFQVIETPDGQPLHVRYIWDELTATTARWQQAFSFDGGTHWETNWIMQFSREAERAAPECCPVVELRQYTLKPGRRDDLIALFEQHFLEGQEQYSMRILGQFRRCAIPDQFVWLRGFSDMEARREALAGFYGGPVWREHRATANDTMLDSDNVLLLKPARATSGLRLDSSRRPALDAPETDGGIVIATIYAFDAPVDNAFIEFFETRIAPAIQSAGASLLGYYVTEPAENNFPQLPVREGEHVFVWSASFADEAAYAAYQTALAGSEEWNASLAPALREWLAKPEEVLELAPTRRSLLRHHLM